MTLRQLMDLIKLRIGMVIALTALTGYAAVAEHILAEQTVPLMLSMVLGSGASALVNHVCDRDMDRLMKRTRLRPLALGVVRPAQALAAALVLMAAGLAVAGMALNWVVALHLALGALVYGGLYTLWLKRRTSWNIVVGGAAGSFAILAGAAAAEPAHWLLPALLAITLFLWTPSHFWALAILLADDYRAAKVPMLPVQVGELNTARAILANSALLVGSSLLPWGMGLLGPVYGVGAAILGLGFLGLNVQLLRKPTRFWAGWNFAASIPYLLGLFAAIFADKHWL